MNLLDELKWVERRSPHRMNFLVWSSLHISDLLKSLHDHELPLPREEREISFMRSVYDLTYRQVCNEESILGKKASLYSNLGDDSFLDIIPADFFNVKNQDHLFNKHGYRLLHELETIGQIQGKRNQYLAEIRAIRRSYNAR